MQLPKFNFTFDDFYVYIMSEECYNSNNAFYITYDHNVHRFKAESYTEYQAKVTNSLINQHTIKIEGFEEKIRFKDGTVHVFYNDKFSPSFEKHTDPVDVVIEVKDGVKNLIINEWPVSLVNGDYYIIDKNVPHYATNEHKGLIFSYGMYDTEQH